MLYRPAESKSSWIDLIQVVFPTETQLVLIRDHYSVHTVLLLETVIFIYENAAFVKGWNRFCI